MKTNPFVSLIVASVVAAAACSDEGTGAGTDVTAGKDTGGPGQDYCSANADCTPPKECIGGRCETPQNGSDAGADASGGGDACGDCDASSDAGGDAGPAGDAGTGGDGGQDDAGIPADSGPNDGAPAPDTGAAGDTGGQGDSGAGHPCDAIRAHAGWEVCEAAETTCAGVFTGGAGCTAYCAAAGMVCVGAFGGDPGCVKGRTVEACESGHQSDWCECAFAAPDGGTPDAGQIPDAGQSGPPASRLPFSYTRTDVGTPVAAQDLAAVTDLYLEILDKTRYFESLDDRVHGWPEGDPQKRFWYGTWWSGAGIEKNNGKVSFVHVDVGGDNNGLRTAQVMEAACFAHLFWGKSSHERLLRKLLRGFNSWILAIERKADDTPVMLSRAAYLENITASDNGKTYAIDYSKNRPGVDNGATEYVNVPQNPHWGNIWIKNKRSKDCLGHMFRAMGQMESCAARLSGDAAQQLAWMRDKYGAWGRQVEADGWKIATINKSGQVWYPTDDLANFYTIGGVECAGQLMLRFMGHGDPGTLSCGSGISSLESTAYFNADLIKTGNKEMMHTYHEAAIAQALVAGQNTVALDLVKGLADRLDRTMNYIDQNGKTPDNVPDGNVTTLVLHAANAGVPLTSREVRWIHDRIRAAHGSYLEGSRMPQYDVFGSLPDGAWPYMPDGEGIQFNNIGLALGSCASVFRNTASRPLLDCERVLKNPR
jgi:hypothetical protein